MPFRARVSPLTIARRQVAAARFASRLAPAPVPAPFAPSIVAKASSVAVAAPGPGPSTFASLQLRRAFNTSSSRPGFADFFRSSTSSKNGKRQADSPALAARVLGSLGIGKLYLLVPAYTALVSAGGRLSEGQLAEVLEALSTRSGYKAAGLRKRIWDELERVHGVQPTEELYRFMIVGCAKASDVPEALRLTQELYEHGGVLAASAWASLANAASATPAPGPRRKLMAQTIEAAKSVNQDTDRTYAALLEPLVGSNKENAMADFYDVISRMRAENKVPGLWVQMQLVAAHIAAGDLEAAREMAASWPALEDIPVEEQKLARELGRSTIALEMACGNPEGVEAAIRALPYGTDMSSAVFVYLVQHRLSAIQTGKLDPDQLLSVVDDIARSVGRDPSQPAWAKLVSNVLAQSDTETAVVVYQAARKRAPFMTPQLARDLVVKLCVAKPPALVQAMLVYDDLVATPTWEENRPKDAEAATEMFAALLRTCDRAQPPAPGIAIELADAAKARGILLPSQDVTHLVVDNMTVSRDHPEAYDVYLRLCPLAAEPFTHRQFSHMLSNFIGLDFPGSNVAPPDYVMNLLSDMRRAGHEPAAAILTSLLKSYAQLSKKVTRHKHKISAAESEFALEALMTATNDVYRLVSLDPMLEVDVPLLVALMDALSSVNAFTDAMEVWDDIVRRRGPAASTMAPAEMQAHYAAALSVVLDTCGYAELPQRAKRIWAWGRRHNLVARRTWAAYIECLARAGRYADALDVLTKEMPEAGLKPTLAETSIPVKFSWRQPKSIAAVLAAIEEHLPEHYDAVAQIVATKQDNKL